MNVPTPSYKGIHTDGYRDAVISCIKTVSKENESGDFINIIPAFVSPEDLRHLKEIASDFKTDAVLFPDYSETLDGESWESYKKISPGGTFKRHCQNKIRKSINSNRKQFIAERSFGFAVRPSA